MPDKKEPKKDRQKDKEEQIVHYENQTIVPIEIKAEMKKAYIDYAMSVIVSRALPDVRDGLKPVHRRILYAMYEDSLFPDKPYRKSATTVGNVLGRYHPHGDASVYDALVRLAQDFSMRYPFVDGHGNFGSVDGDPPAAYRYTEARMSRISMEMLRDIEKETVPFGPNFDDDRKEPQVLPARIPGLLVNGSAGIAVGMATNIPPHNLGEVVDAIDYLIDHPDAPGEELMRFVKGPDFPTGGLIMGVSGIRAAYLTGRGRIIMRAKTEIEENNGKYKIVVTELPYQVNKARLIESIAGYVRDKRITGISFLQDESDREGMRIAIDVKRDANPQIVLNQLFKLTQMQETFGAIMLALVDGRPKTLTLREILQEYVKFQEQVIRNRTVYDLRRARERAHILEGLTIAVDNIDEVIRIIRESYDNAKENLCARFGLSDIQAKAILELQLRRLQGLEREKLQEEFEAIRLKIADYEDILAHEERVLQVFRQELGELRAKFGDERRTQIEPVENELDIEDLIAEEDMIVTRTHFGYIKRVPMDTYKAQHRGGRGINAMATRTEDFVEELFIASTHAHVLFFTSAGRVYRLKCYTIPAESRTARGTNIVNLLDISPDEKITAVIPVEGFDDESHFLTMVTRAGTVKRTSLREYATARRGGLIAILLDEGDRLETVKLTDGEQELMLCTRAGKAIRFAESDVRPMGRAAHGVRGIELGEDDYVVGMSLAREGGNLLTVTEKGYGKRTPLAEYKLQNRGGKGLINYNLTAKTGAVAGIKVVDDTDDVMLISSDGTIIRTGAAEIPLYSRATQGVKVMRITSEDSYLVTVARTEKEDSEDGTGDLEAEDEAEGGLNGGAEDGADFTDRQDEAAADGALSEDGEE